MVGVDADDGRSTKGAYEDDKAIAGRRFVKERFAAPQAD